MNNFSTNWLLFGFIEIHAHVGYGSYENRSYDRVPVYNGGNSKLATDQDNLFSIDNNEKRQILQMHDLKPGSFDSFLSFQIF